LPGHAIMELEVNLAACGGAFLGRINKINKIFLYSLYPEHPVSEFRNSEAILSKKGNSYTIELLKINNSF
jgi:hypothetical protein